jgi:hypothetical protein
MLKERGGKNRVSLTGLDVQNNHYPAPANLPSNITLGFLDAFNEDLTAEHIGAYDVVHIRACASVVKNDDAGPCSGTHTRCSSLVAISNRTIWMAARSRLWLRGRPAIFHCFHGSVG